MDGINMPVKIDTSKSKFSAVPQDELETYEMNTNPKQKMKELWEKVKKSKEDLHD